MMLATDNQVPAAALKGRAMGALFMAGFGALRVAIGLKFLQRLDWRSLLSVLAVAAALVV
jgi:hypothetical protein